MATFINYWNPFVIFELAVIGNSELVVSLDQNMYYAT